MTTTCLVSKVSAWAWKRQWIGTQQFRGRLKTELKERAKEVDKLKERAKELDELDELKRAKELDERRWIN